MNLEQITTELAGAATDAARAAVWRVYPLTDAVALAYALKDICLNDGWSGNPAQCVGAAAALRWLGQHAPHAEITALRAWCEGLAAVAHGRYEPALPLFQQAERRFRLLGNPRTAAETQVVKLYALAMLGRYDEAVECGLQARAVFLAHGDELAAGKVENNLGNIYFRRDLYQTAEHFQSLARQRFAALQHQVQLAKINNCLANTHAHLHRFASAEELYAEAWHAATAADLPLTQAEIASNRGNLALFQGRYDVALDWLEQARRKYVALALPHQATLTELEIADIYLELNLLPEAVELYQRAAPTFAALGMRAEQARALAQHGRALSAAGQTLLARPLLLAAKGLYAVEENSVGAASVTLSEAQAHYADTDFAAACRAATQTAWALRHTGNWRRFLWARWLGGEAARADGQTRRAQRRLQATRRAAEVQAQPALSYRCQVSLGLAARAENRPDEAAAAFRSALELGEVLRAPLLAEEFRAAFFADKLIPYQELMRLCIDAGQLSEAFGYAEQARARALAERLAQPTGNAVENGPPDAFTTNAQARLRQLRTELSWYYNLLNRPAAPAAPLAEWHEAMRAREQETLEIARQLQHRSGPGQVVSTRSGSEEVGLAEIANQTSQITRSNSNGRALAQLQATLGPEAALIEYAALDGTWLAFVVTAQEIVTVRGLGLVAETQRLVERLQFQLRAPRYGRAAIAAHKTQLVARAQFYLRALHEILLARIIPHAPQPHWIIIPHGVLNYVPFHALHDGQQYVVEQREIVVAPSATVWQHCRTQTTRKWENALLLGVGDERAPLVREEVAALAPLFRQTLTLLDEAATLDALRANLPAADVLHWASHGHFRPDNPLFSRLRLGDGWLTVREAETLPLAGRLVTLSACETGLSRIAPGQEITGLARGFFAAGARSLVLSLWTVDDAAAVALMTVFYQSLRAGQTPAAALRVAQRELLLQYSHPFYWSPFVLLGAG